MGAESDEGNARLPLLDPAALNPEQRRLYEAMRASLLPWAKASDFAAETEDGRLLGPFNAFLYSPEIGAAALKYLFVVNDTTSLDQRVREVVILTVAAALGAAYGMYAHRAVAAKAGLAAADIEALAAGRLPGEGSALRPEERVAQRFAQAVAVDHRVSPELYAEAVQVFGHKGLVDMLHLAGIYMAVSSMLNAFAVAVPEA